MTCPKCERRPCSPMAGQCAGCRSARRTGRQREPYRSGWQRSPVRRLQAKRAKAATA
jgi:hypothetical protein